MALELARRVPGLSARTAYAAITAYGDLVAEALLAGKRVMISRHTISFTPHAWMRRWLNEDQFTFMVRTRTSRWLREKAKQYLTGEGWSEPKPPEHNANKTNVSTERARRLSKMREARNLQRIRPRPLV